MAARKKTSRKTSKRAPAKRTSRKSSRPARPIRLARNGLIRTPEQLAAVAVGAIVESADGSCAWRKHGKTDWERMRPSSASENGWEPTRPPERGTRLFRVVLREMQVGGLRAIQQRPVRQNLGFGSSVQKPANRDIAVLLDEAEAMIGRVWERIDQITDGDEMQDAARSLMVASVVAEGAYARNCESNDTEQCWRSGEVLIQAQDVMDALIGHALEVGTPRQRLSAMKKKILPWM